MKDQYISKVDLGTDLHTNQLANSRHSRWLPVRIAKAIYKEWKRGPTVYGTEWGDPETWTPLQFVRDHYVLPFVNPDHVAVDIGCGGGRWTHYLLGFKTVYAVDYYASLLAEFKKAFARYKHVHAIKNNGTDFPGVAPQSVDFVFSFGCFGHLNLDLIDSYLSHIKTILKPGGNAIVHFSDKSKPIAGDPAFSDNSPEKMRAMVLRHGFEIVGIDNGTMWNGGIIHFKA